MRRVCSLASQLSLVLALYHPTRRTVFVQEGIPLDPKPYSTHIYMLYMLTFYVFIAAAVLKLLLHLLEHLLPLLEGPCLKGEHGV